MTPRRKPERPERPYLGYRAGDRDTSFAEYFRPEMAPLAPHVVEALAVGPVAAPLLTELDDVGHLLDEGDEAIETGYATDRDGSIRVAVHTPMPVVTPAMWDWWFGWHGDDTRKYKLWHPRAHLFAQWADDGSPTGPRNYVGRTSFVDEYLGSKLARAAIRFIAPGELGFDETRLADAELATVVCARVGLSGQPVDAGYLVHHVRRTDDGSEMRSRFWIGGRHTAPRTANTVLSRAAPLMAKAARFSPQDAADLLVHCAQEMGHLATFLPALHAELGDG